MTRWAHPIGWMLAAAVAAAPMAAAQQGAPANGEWPGFFLEL